MARVGEKGKADGVAATSAAKDCECRHLIGSNSRRDSDECQLPRVETE